MTVIRLFNDPARQSAREAAEADGLAGEHGVLTRQMAALQRRVSEQLADCMGQIRRLEADVVRLRGRLVRARTALSWGLAGASLPAQTRVLTRSATVTRTTHDPAMPQASAVICRTGCSGHAHPWLEADGQCRRTGSACAPSWQPTPRGLGPEGIGPDATAGPSFFRPVL